MKKMVGQYPLGVWFAIIALILLFLAWVMQGYSLIDWDKAVDLGIQNERFGGDPVEEAWALESFAVVIADLIWALPIWIIAFIGIIRKKVIGFVAAFMELAIGVYFPLVFAFQRWNTFRETVFIALLLWVVPSLIGIIGLWMNKHFFLPTKSG